MRAHWIAVGFLLPAVSAAVLTACGGGGGHGALGGATAPHNTPYATVTASGSNGAQSCFVINAGFTVGTGKAEVQTVNQLSVPVNVTWSDGTTAAGSQDVAPHGTSNAVLDFKSKGTYTPTCRVAGQSIPSSGTGLTVS